MTVTKGGGKHKSRAQKKSNPEMQEKNAMAKKCKEEAEQCATRCAQNSKWSSFSSMTQVCLLWLRLPSPSVRTNCT